MIRKSLSFLLLFIASGISFTAAWPADLNNQANPASLKELLTRATEAYDKKDAVEAKHLFEKALDLEPENADANYSLGRIYDDWGDLPNAKHYYLRVLKTKPDDFEAADALDLVNKKLQNAEKLHLPLRLPSDKLVHKMVMKATPVGLIIFEICKRSGLTAIIDKSVDGKTFTATYSDALQSEVLASIFSSCQLEAQPLTNGMVLIQSSNAEHKEYPPSDVPQDTLPDQTSADVPAAHRPQPKSVSTIKPVSIPSGWVPPPPPTPVETPVETP